MNTDRELMQLALEALDGTEALLSSMDVTHLLIYGEVEKAVTALREALAEQPAQHQGWKLVPVEPTPEMLKAADDGDDEYTRRNFGPAVHRVMQGPYDHYIAMLNAASQPAQQQEPVAWRWKMSLIPDAWQLSDQPHPEAALKEPLYTSPPASKPWVRLTLKETTDIELSLRQYHNGDSYDLSLSDYARAIEAKLREKNA